MLTSLIPLPYRWAVLALILAAFGSFCWVKGAAHAQAKTELVDAARVRQDQAALATLNARLKTAQTQLDSAIARVDQLQTDLNHEKDASAALQSDLAAGRVRLSVLTRARVDHPAATVEGVPAASVDQGRGITADLDGRAASDLEWMRETRDAANKGLHACIVAYDAVKTASDAP